MDEKSFRLTLRPKAYEVVIHMHGKDVACHPLINEGQSYLLLTLESYK